MLIDKQQTYILTKYSEVKCQWRDTIKLQSLEIFNFINQNHN